MLRIRSIDVKKKAKDLKSPMGRTLGLGFRL